MEGKEDLSRKLAAFKAVIRARGSHIKGPIVVFSSQFAQELRDRGYSLISNVPPFPKKTNPPENTSPRPPRSELEALMATLEKQAYEHDKARYGIK